MDVQGLIRAVDLRALAEEAGAKFQFNKNSSHCPLHGGTNPTAFHLYRGRDGEMRWHCFTGCQADGDALAFVQRWQRVDFAGAVAELERRVGAAPPAPAPGPALREEPTAPDQAWQERAMAFISYAQDELWTRRSQAMAYLIRRRGLMEDAIGAWGLGWNPRDLWDDPARWGLEGKRVWLPRGVVIPGWRDNGLWYVKIRRPLGADMDLYGLAEPGPAPLPGMKYANVRGGRQTFFGECRLAGRATLVVVEGEFDAILLHQFAGDLVDVATLGGASTQLTMADLLTLARYRRVVAAQDNDAAGERAQQRLAALGERVMVSPPPGHDVTDAWREGGAEAVRRWVAAAATC